MDKKPLRIKSLKINKMPGLRNGLEPYNDISDNINIISGPNASGKSSTARAIEKILWPQETRGMRADCSLQVDEEEWKVHIDSTEVISLHNGKNERLSGIPSSETGNRYMLSLHELIREDDGDIARQISQESIGGYDLDDAKDKLEYSDKLRRKSSNEFKEFGEAKKSYQEALRKQQKLQSREKELENLHQRRSKAEEAKKYSELYEKVLAYKKAESDYLQVKERFDQFPEIFEKITGEEYEKLQEYKKEIEEIEKNINKHKSELKDCEDELSDLNLPEEGVDEKILEELKSKTNTLKELDSKINELREKKTDYKTKADEALKEIDVNTDSAEWEGISLDEISNLDKFLEEAHQKRSEVQYLNTRINTLNDKLEENEKADTVKLREGIRTLSYWLGEKSGGRNISKKWLIILGSVVVLSGIIVAILGAIPLTAILLIIAAVLMYFFGKSDQKETIRAEYFRDTGLEEPEAWTREAVSDYIHKLVKQLEQAEWTVKLEQEIDHLKEEKKESDREFDKVKERYNNLKEKLKLVPGLPEDDLKNYSEMYWYIIHLKEWRKNHVEATSCAANLEELLNEKNSILEELNEVLGKFGESPAKDTVQAIAVYQELEKKERQRKEAVKDLRHKQEKINDANQQKSKIQQKLAEIYSKIEIEQGDEYAVKKLMDDLPDYKGVKAQLNTNEQMLREKKTGMTEHSFYKAAKGEITDLLIDEAEENMKEFSETASGLENIRDEIKEIETLIEEAKKNNETETALSRLDKARNDLYNLYETNMSEITGHLLVEQLKKETSNENRPEVFRRAHQLFAKITSGRYQLNLEDSKRTAFTAYDKVTEIEHPLEELSTGTRIQLLLSVRLAFIETQESLYKLPILADELLANSDDVRAQAIIEALIGISRDGRQVFYFTAQHDEVAKWKHFMNQKDDISASYYDLAGKSGKEQSEMPTPAFSEIPLKTANLPSPADHDHESYGEALEIPDFNLLVDKAGSLHLWYVIDDLDTLYGFLQKGIQYLGELENYINAGGEADKDFKTEIKEKGEIIRKFLKMYRQDRPVPIDAEVLEQSKAVSSKFFSEVNGKLQELNCDPEALIQNLRQGEVSGFRTNKIDELEEYLLQENYISKEEAMDKAELRSRIHAMLSGMHLDADRCESVLNRLLNSRNQV